MKMRHFVWLLAAMLAVPTAGFAMKHMENEDHGKMEMKEEGHGGMQGHNMKGMSGMNDMVMLGSKTTDGVIAVGHLMPVTEKEKDSMGMKMTHNFMIMCNDEKTGDYIEEGLAALKVTDPSGHTSEAMKLMPMPMGMVKGFATGVDLSEKGTYKFEVGSKLGDDKKRQFEFDYTVK